MPQLTGKVAIVTGATGNLGHAVSRALMVQGARVALAGRDTDSLDAARAALPAGDAACFIVDLTDPRSVAGLAEQVKARFGRIDILTNIAGGFTMGPPLHETSDADWDLMMNLNARSIFYGCRAVIPHLLAGGGGRIVNVSARAAREGRARRGALLRREGRRNHPPTESLAAEHKDDNINVNCILPGTIDTPENRAAMPDQDFAKWVPPEALADVILFLVSDAARCITGAAIPVYGRS